MRNDYRLHQLVFDFVAGTGALRVKRELGPRDYLATFSGWRSLEEWARSHPEREIQELASRAYDHHDQKAMNRLKLEYDWFLKGME